MSRRPSLADSMRKFEQPVATPASVPSSPAEPESSTPKGYFAATRANLAKVTAPISPEAHKQFRLLAVETGKKGEGLLREALNDLFTKYGKPPIA